MQHFRMLIGGEICDGAGGDRFESTDPGSGEVIATVARAGEAEVRAAVDAARRAFDSGAWSGKTPAERAEILIEWADLVQAALPRLALLEALDSGGLIARTGSDVFQGARFIRSTAVYAASRFPWREEILQRNFPFSSSNYVRREPVGVCVGIIPWNFPFLMAVWKIGMALAAGNTVILKPATDTPLSALALAETVAQSRIPPGVVNVIAGPGKEVGERLCLHPGVDKIAFTGSTEVGARVLEMAARGIKKATMELGGKSANIILDDADMEMAVDGALFASFLHSGQVCESGTRLFVPESRAAELEKRLVERIRGVKIGHQLDPATRMGPVVSEKQRATVERYIEIGKKGGARLACGGGRAEVPGFEGGFYVQPTIFADVRNDMTIAREEIFGPVLCVLTYRSEDEAVALANDSAYGLAAGVWSRDLTRAERTAHRLRAGTVWINDYHVFHDHGPFGGYRQSGIGRELGHHGLAEYTEIKHVHVGTEGDPNAKVGHRLLLKRDRSRGYEYEPVTRIISGPGSLNRLHSELSLMQKGRALVVTDAGVANAGILKRVQQILGPRVAAVFADVPQDSGIEVIDAAAEIGRRHDADVVVSLGGGSVIDTAKGVCVALKEGVPAVQAIGMHQLTRRQTTHVAVPTTAGTGSEVTNVAVIKNRRSRAKAYIIDRHIVPDLAVLDPSLTVGLPPLLTASTGLDALTHAVEAYTSKTANPMSDAQALHAIRLIAANLETAVKEPGNLSARTHMQGAATLAGWAFGSAGVGLVHGMSHALGARHGVPHGVGNGILLPHIMRFNAGVPQAVARLRDVAAALGADVAGRPADWAEAAATRVTALLAATGHPTRLSETTAPRDDLAACAEAAFLDPANLSNARRVGSPQEILALYETAW